MGLGWEGVRGETGYRVLFYLFTPRPSVARPALVLHVAQTLALRRCINHHAALHPRVKVAFSSSASRDDVGVMHVGLPPAGQTQTSRAEAQAVDVTSDSRPSGA